VVTEVVGLGAWCDFVTEDEYRHHLQEQASLPDEVDEAADRSQLEPRPAVWRPNPDEIEAEIRHFRRGISFRVVEFATLADGRRLTPDEDRGFGMSGPPLADLLADLTLEGLEADVRSTVLPDNDDTQDEHDWEWLAECLRNSGVQVSPHDLQGLPYDVAFSERLRARMVG
jgi:hypothetical protein